MCSSTLKVFMFILSPKRVVQGFHRFAKGFILWAQTAVRLILSDGDLTERDPKEGFK